MDEDDALDVPEYFTCPISLQLMRDPVTAVTGITYDRDSIEHWLLDGKNVTCPVTKQPLTRGSDLTPNHTLPTPKAPLDKYCLLKLVGDIQRHRSEVKTLSRIETLAVENERNRNLMIEIGVPKAVMSYIADCFDQNRTAGLEEALSILILLRVPSTHAKLLVGQNDRIIKTLTWVLGCEVHDNVTVRSHAVIILKKMIKAASSAVLERLNSEFFRNGIWKGRMGSLNGRIYGNGTINGKGRDFYIAFLVKVQELTFWSFA